MRHPRANQVSSFAVMQGALIDETYMLLASWDTGRSTEENVAAALEANTLGAASRSWLEDILRAITRRLDPSGRDRALATLARRQLALDEWKPLLLWHITRDEFLLRDFLQEFLYPAFVSGHYRLRPADVLPYLSTLAARGGVVRADWTHYTRLRVARALLKTAAAFGLLVGNAVREFASYHLPERSLLYLLHALQDDGLAGQRLLASADWRLFLVSPSDLEHELLRLHQFRKLDYNVAGSLVQLALPCATAVEYADRMLA